MTRAIVKKWCNADNDDFYEKMSLSEFIDHAEKSGIAQGEDVKQINEKIMEAKSILEIGSGYGRVLKHLNRATTSEKNSSI